MSRHKLAEAVGWDAIDNLPALASPEYVPGGPYSDGGRIAQRVPGFVSGTSQRASSAPGSSGELRGRGPPPWLADGSLNLCAIGVCDSLKSPAVGTVVTAASFYRESLGNASTTSVALHRVRKRP